MTAGWITATRENLSSWAAKSLSGTSKKLNLWSPERRRSMNRNLLQNRWQHLSESVIRRAQAEQLRRYLRTVVLPFSAHYRQLFEEQGLDVESIRTLDDLQRIPFTSKADLINTAAQPNRFRNFILIPDTKVLARRPGTIVRALLHGREQVKKEFESEFRPIFMTATTGRSAEPTPFLYSHHDLAR